MKSDMNGNGTGESGQCLLLVRRSEEVFCVFEYNLESPKRGDTLDLPVAPNGSTLRFQVSGITPRRTPRWGITERAMLVFLRPEEETFDTDRLLVTKVTPRWYLSRKAVLGLT